RAAARALPPTRESVRRRLRRQPADQCPRRALCSRSRAARRHVGRRRRRRRASRRRPRDRDVERAARARRRGPARRADRRRGLGRRTARRAADHRARRVRRRADSRQHRALRARARAAPPLRSAKRPTRGLAATTVRRSLQALACGLHDSVLFQCRGAARPRSRPRDKEVEMFCRFARHLPLTFLIPLASLAQPIEDDESGTPLAMEEVIVTGTASPERTKYESSVAITTFEADDLRRESPQSTADLVESVPGFWVESTSGETHGNVFARGISQGGGYRYVGLMEDGIPIYPVFDLSFYVPDQLVRVDRTVRRVEVVRGGTAPIFTSGAVGGTINFITREPAG